MYTKKDSNGRVNKKSETKMVYKPKPKIQMDLSNDSEDKEVHEREDQNSGSSSE